MATASGNQRATRSSIRHSLNFTSVGKALVDVMNKESRDEDKKTSKMSRRSSSFNMKPTVAPRVSMGDKPSTSVPRRTQTPDSKTVTRKRNSVVLMSTTVTEDGMLKPVESTAELSQQETLARKASLRPRPGLSGLPKYRPKSFIQDNGKKTSSPLRVGIRRRLPEDDEKTSDSSEQAPIDKSLRPISPLPHRAIPQSSTPPSHLAKGKKGTPSSTKSKSSPVRPTKHVKMASSTSIPRPSSAASSASSSSARRTPTQTSSATKLIRRDSPGKGNIFESPLARHSRKASQSNIPDSSSIALGNMSHISEGDAESDCEDSDEEDVAMLLAPTASLAAPTPAMPRFDGRRSRYQQEEPYTPTRGGLSARSDISYASPSPRKNKSSLNQPGSGAPRGSIMTFDQLADTSFTLSADELGNLAEIPAPFRSGATSPVMGRGSILLDIPESPCLSAMNSPGGYGSISQVLLPQVTPSPAVHYQTRYQTAPPALDSATVTLLRLQLASVEDVAQKRLAEIEELRDQLQMRESAASDLTKQFMILQDTMEERLQNGTRAAEERLAQNTILQSQLEDAQRSTEESLAKAKKDMMASQGSVVMKTERRLMGYCMAKSAAREWESVKDMTMSELVVIENEMETLAVLLSQLDLVEARLHI